MASATAATDRRFLTELNAEWRRLVEREGGTRPSVWAPCWPCFIPYDSLAELIADGRSRDDTVLAALLVTQRRGDQVAGRVVLQALLPGMVRMAARDRTADLSDYVTQLWCRIQTYPLDRRPARIANNLELDTLKWICRDRSSSPATPIEPDSIELLWRLRQRTGRAEPDAPAVIGAAVAHGLIDDDTGVVLRSVYADGLSGREAADRHRCSVDLIRWRCSTAVRTLARHATLLAEVA